MDSLMLRGLEGTIGQLAEAVQELSRQVQVEKDEESERLGSFKEGDALLEFTLVTSGLIMGRILWVGDRSLGVRTDTGQDIILYKHAIAFIQKQAAG